MDHNQHICFLLIELHDIFTDLVTLERQVIDEEVLFNYKYFYAFENANRITRDYYKDLLEKTIESYKRLRRISYKTNRLFYSTIELNKAETINFVKHLTMLITKGLDITESEFSFILKMYKTEKNKKGGVAFVMLDNLSFGRRLNVFNHATCEALVSASVSFFVEWKGLNPLQILYKTLFIWLSFVVFIFYVITGLFDFIGKLFYALPLVNVVFAGLNYLFYIIGVGFALLGNLHNPKELLKTLNEGYVEGIFDSLHPTPF